VSNGPGPSKSRDFHACLVAAEAFWRLAEPFIARIAQDVKSGVQDPSRELGDLVASAANLGFALELYLKALLELLGATVPRDHDLGRLYRALPQEVRTEIEQRYDSTWRTQWSGKRASITVAKGPRDEPTWKDNRKEPKNLAPLLKRSKDLFQAWKYVFEFTQPGDNPYQYHQFEYGLLLCACEAIRSAIEQRVQQADEADEA